MSAMSDYLEQALANHIFRATAYTQPTNLHIALFTSAPNDAGGGTEVPTSGTGYQRVSVARGNSSFTLNGSTISNTNVVTFNPPSVNWGTVTHFGIFDAGTAGNLLFHGALTPAGGKTVNAGDTVTFPAGQLQITFD